MQWRVLLVAIKPVAVLLLVTEDDECLLRVRRVKVLRDPKEKIWFLSALKSRASSSCV